MSKPNLRDILADKYVIFLCEGTNEESALKFSLQHGIFCVKQDCYRDDLTRKGRGKGIAKNIEPELHFDYGRPIAIVYILDSPKEKIKLKKEYLEKVSVYYILTPPEFEMLYILKNGWSEEYDKKKRSLNPSRFCADKMPDVNTKDKDAFSFHFSDPKEFARVCRAYKAYHLRKGKPLALDQFYLADLLEDEA